MRAGSGARTYDVDDDKQEQPDDIDEVPIPSRGFKAEMLFRGERTVHGAQQADAQENCSDDDMETMKAGSHIKS